MVTLIGETELFEAKPNKRLNNLTWGAKMNAFLTEKYRTRFST